MSRLYLLDSNVYIRAFRDLSFGVQLRDFHQRHLSRLIVSSVVASELLVGAQSADRDRRIRRTLIEPFQARRRLVTPGWSTWDLATQIDRRIRARSTHRPRLNQRSFFQDILIAATAREVGATIITENDGDFALIRNHVDIAFVSPFPATSVA